MCNTANKIVICQLQNAKSNFPKFRKGYAWQNQKTNLIHLNRGNHCFNSSFKSRFQEYFLVSYL